jgi:hypothetical protein
MAKNESAATAATAALKNAPKKRQLGKKLQQFLPFVRWHAGLVVCGTIERKFINSSNYGEKNNIEIKLLDPCEFTTGEGEVVTVAAGESLNVGSTAGLSTAMTLPTETTVQIECTGKKELGQGRKPAWEFDIEYE